VDKIDDLAKEDQTLRPVRIVFMVSSAVQASIRDSILKYCPEPERGYECEVGARRIWRPGGVLSASPSGRIAPSRA
jgi:hypothetical protein